MSQQLNINRNNYEEFFMLYADNELSAFEKQQVEIFVTENPDLEEELIMLRQTVLIPEKPVEFPWKNLLYKQNDFINSTTSESIFTLYHDDELSEEERKKTQDYLKQHPEEQQVFLQIQQCKLQPEKISFPDKSSLYRNEKKIPIIPMAFWRMAAAAVLLAFLVFTGYKFFSEKKVTDTAGVKLPAEKITSPSVPEIKESEGSKDPAINQLADNLATPAGKEIEKVVEKKSAAVADNPTLAKKPSVVEKRVQVPVISEEKQSQQEMIVKNEIQPQTNDLPKPEEQVKSLTGVASGESELINTVNNDVAATQVAYREAEVNNKDNYVFYNISEEKFKKSKLGIFLKKAKRVVTRNSFFGKGKIASVEPDAK